MKRWKPTYATKASRHARSYAMMIARDYGKTADEILAECTPTGTWNMVTSYDIDRWKQAQPATEPPHPAQPN